MTDKISGYLQLGTGSVWEGSFGVSGIVEFGLMRKVIGNHRTSVITPAGNVSIHGKVGKSGEAVLGAMGKRGGREFA